MVTSFLVRLRLDWYDVILESLTYKNHDFALIIFLGKAKQQLSEYTWFEYTTKCITLNSFLKSTSKMDKIKIADHIPSFSANKLSNICMSGDLKYIFSMEVVMILFEPSFDSPR